jgi:hypothetical protein
VIGVVQQCGLHQVKNGQVDDAKQKAQTGESESAWGWPEAKDGQIAMFYEMEEDPGEQEFDYSAYHPIKIIAPARASKRQI